MEFLNVLKVLVGKSLQVLCFVKLSQKELSLQDVTMEILIYGQVRLFKAQFNITQLMLHQCMSWFLEKREISLELFQEAKTEQL